MPTIFSIATFFEFFSGAFVPTVHTDEWESDFFQLDHFSENLEEKKLFKI